MINEKKKKNTTQFYRSTYDIICTPSLSLTKHIYALHNQHDRHKPTIAYCFSRALFSHCPFFIKKNNNNSMLINLRHSNFHYIFFPKIKLRRIN